MAKRSPSEGDEHVMRSSPSSFPLYAVITLMWGLTLAMGWWGLTAQSNINWQAVVVLSALGVLGTNMREMEYEAGLSVSFTTVVLAAAIVLAGPVGAVLVGVISSLCDFRSFGLASWLSNAAMTGCMAGAGAATYFAVNGLDFETRKKDPELGMPSPSEILSNVALPMLAGYVLLVWVNAVLIGLLIAATQRRNAFTEALLVIQSLGPGYVVHVLVAVLLVVLWQPVGIGPFSAVLVIIPLLLTQWALSRNAAERRSQARTVETLMGALEVATPYSVGHSSRVATLARHMAPLLNITGDHADDLNFAALLHDLGLVSASPKVPPGTSPSDVSYLAAIQEHPQAGVNMLSDIAFLKPGMTGILHHHERFDGLGYPAGLAGDAIPIFARVIAVADAFDSLTTNRSYREELSGPEALERLRLRAGTHLDPEIVEALARALENAPWEPTRIGDAALASAVDVNDHDDPAVSDEYAAWQPESDEARA